MARFQRKDVQIPCKRKPGPAIPLSWIKAQIETGHYGNESEVLRELIRERQLREQKSSYEIEAIRAKLIEAERSGFTEQTPEEILQEIKNGLGRSDAI